MLALWSRIMSARSSAETYSEPRSRERVRDFHDAISLEIALFSITAMTAILAFIYVVNS
jgi:hypothetical protein